MPATITPARDLARLTDEQLLQIHWEGGDIAARDELVRRFMPFARKLAIRYLHSREPLDDLVQVANLGLLNAIERFQPGRGRSFTAYAAPTILGELKRHFRDKGWSLHVPRDLKERALAAGQHARRLSTELGRSPTVDELAVALGCTIEQTTEALDAADNYHPQSLDAPVGDDDEDLCPLLERLGGEDHAFELADDRQALAASWKRLSDTERQVLGLRLLRGLTQREISQRIGYSQMHVSRLLRRSMLRLDTAEGSATPARRSSSDLIAGTDRAVEQRRSERDPSVAVVGRVSAGEPGGSVAQRAGSAPVAGGAGGRGSRQQRKRRRGAIDRPPGESERLRPGAPAGREDVAPPTGGERARAVAARGREPVRQPRRIEAVPHTRPSARIGDRRQAAA